MTPRGTRPSAAPSRAITSPRSSTPSSARSAPTSSPGSTGARAASRSSTTHRRRSATTTSRSSSSIARCPARRRAPVRLDGGPRADETVRVVGWGVTDTSSNPQTRQQRGGVKVLAVGPADHLGPSEFKLGESGCAGDSGGPAFAESSGAVLGVLSRGGNGGGATPGDPAACIDAENVFTSAAAFKDLIARRLREGRAGPVARGRARPHDAPSEAPGGRGGELRLRARSPGRPAVAVGLRAGARRSRRSRLACRVASRDPERVKHAISITGRPSRGVASSCGSRWRMPARVTSMLLACRRRRAGESKRSSR